MSAETIALYAALYFAAGLGSDRLCEYFSRQQGKEYDWRHQLVMYLIGPVLVPAAFLHAIVLAIFSGHGRK